MQKHFEICKSFSLVFAFSACFLWICAENYGKVAHLDGCVLNKILPKINKAKKTQKNFKKSVDKMKSVCYTSGALLRKWQCKRSLKIEQQRFMID